MNWRPSSRDLTEPRPCSTNGDMGSQVLSIRIQTELLEEVRKRARLEGRSVSGEIVFLVRDQLGTAKPPKRASRPVTGFLSKEPSPASLGDFTLGRSAASSALLRSVRRKAKRR